VNLHFISNIDPEPLLDLFATLNPETTLFIIASKSFTTQETFVNANVARDWIVQTLGAKAIEKHFVAITAHVKKALTYGLLEENILPLWDWVGGRYSLWSTIGLSIAISIGMEHFVQFLQGAEEMDQHFYSAPFEQNMPIILALLGIWYINFFNIHTQAIIPYSEALRSLPHYLQQLDMESNGKSVDQQGHKITYNTAPIIWGAVGTNSQHACHQLFHQGPHFLPIDFIIPLKPSHPLQANQDILFANCLAQAEALMLGKTENEAYDELIFTGMDPIQAKSLAKHKSIQGSKPSNLLLLDDISPRSIGALIALYEHKVFVQGVIWNINSFDQWGVELGKQLGHKILDVIHHKTDLASQDPSTQNLLKKYRKSFSS
jgi:glucose-6-phosphate isomerase